MTLAPLRPKESTAEQVMRFARDVNQELWSRTENVAKIIDPSAFMTDWVITPKESADLHAARLKYKQAVAMEKAHQILHYLGVNTDTDWLEILSRIAEEGS